MLCWILILLMPLQCVNFVQRNRFSFVFSELHKFLNLENRHISKIRTKITCKKTNCILYSLVQWSSAQLTELTWHVLVRKSLNWVLFMQPLDVFGLDYSAEINTVRLCRISDSHTMPSYLSKLNIRPLNQ